MGESRLSPSARADVAAIAEYTTRAHGKPQCSLYLSDLEACFARLAKHPGLGVSCDQVSPDLRQCDQGRHVVFYRERPYGVRIVRVLHARMLPGQHDMSDAGDEA